MYSKEQIEMLTRSEFKEYFFGEFVPLSFILKKDVEFHDLRLEKLSVSAYDH